MIYQKFINLDTLYDTIERPVIINEFKITDDIKASIITAYGDSISLVAECGCKALRGNYRAGMMCDYCNTEVTSILNDPSPRAWVAALTPNVKFINPMFVHLLDSLISRQTSTLSYLMRPNHRPKRGVTTTMSGLLRIIGGKRGYLHVIKNFDKILAYLATTPIFKKPHKAANLKLLVTIYNNNKHILFSNHIPLFDKSIFVEEDTSKGKYITTHLSDVVDIAVAVIMNANDPTKTVSERANIMGDVVLKTVVLYKDIVSTLIGRKKGLIRSTILASRNHMTYRAVVVASDVERDYNTTQVSWTTMLAILDPMITNKLLKRNYTLKAASKLIYGSNRCYNKLIHDIINEIIEEAKKLDEDSLGIPVLMNRNPSLGLSSIMLMYIDRVKTDVLDTTNSVSVLATNGSGTDYDGDSLNASLLLDKKMYLMAKVFTPFLGGISLDVFKVHKNMNLCTTSSLTLTNYINKKEKSTKTDRIFRALTK